MIAAASSPKIQIAITRVISKVRESRRMGSTLFSPPERGSVQRPVHRELPCFDRRQFWTGLTADRVPEFDQPQRVEQQPSEAVQKHGDQRGGQHRTANKEPLLGVQVHGSY